MSELNQTTNLAAPNESAEMQDLARAAVFFENESGFDAPDFELGMWLQALRSFASARNHPFPEADLSPALSHDWKPEVRIARRAMLRISQLTLHLVHAGHHSSVLFDETDDEAISNLGQKRYAVEAYDPEMVKSLLQLAEAMGHACTIAEALLETPTVGFHVWTSLGQVVERELDHIEAVRHFVRDSIKRASSRLHPDLTALVRDQVENEDLSTDMQLAFGAFFRVLEWLRFIETALRRDYPLKRTMPIFALLYDEVRAIIAFISGRALRTENIGETVYETLDGTNYAITMELRKVFARELVGLSALRQSPAIYAKVENSHGLLRDCFQQSVVALAQAFDPELDGARLFPNFQTKLDQSLLLRTDIWKLLQKVRRSENEPEGVSQFRLHRSMREFRDGSLRFLMFKDWETTERFVEEVVAARGPGELVPVLHRFGAYLETLLGQVNMRAVLALHPFDYPALEEETGS
ncbi:MAG: hypothetical protein ABIP75_02230 [Pyrinomonadaceae bacterium]